MNTLLKIVLEKGEWHVISSNTEEPERAALAHSDTCASIIYSDRKTPDVAVCEVASEMYDYLSISMTETGNHLKELMDKADYQLKSLAQAKEELFKLDKRFGSIKMPLFDTSVKPEENSDVMVLAQTMRQFMPAEYRNGRFVCGEHDDKDIYFMDSNVLLWFYTPAKNNVEALVLKQWAKRDVLELQEYYYGHASPIEYDEIGNLPDCFGIIFLALSFYGDILGNKEIMKYVQLSTPEDNKRGIIGTYKNYLLVTNAFPNEPIPNGCKLDGISVYRM